MKVPFLLLGMVFLAFAACKNTVAPQNDTNDREKPEVTGTSDAPASKCIAPKTGEIPESDPFLSAETRIAGNCLEATITYSGGCQEHEFALYWNEMWAESMPPQTQIFLYHNSNGDKCRALKNETVSFALP